MGSKTWGQFFEDLDQAMEDAGIDAGVVARLQAETASPRATEETVAALNELLLPVYCQLRLSKYSHADLRR